MQKERQQATENYLAGEHEAVEIAPAPGPRPEPALQTIFTLAREVWERHQAEQHGCRYEGGRCVVHDGLQAPARPADRRCAFDTEQLTADTPSSDDVLF